MSAAFQFIRRLGAGAFGEVWYVNDLGLNAHFALKVIPPDKVINPSNFYQEAQTLKAAEHPNIVEVYEAGEMDDGRVYVKMEYLKNGSLEDEASGAYVPLVRSKKVMIDVLRGLEFAHSKGIVHRDIKPANILIGYSKEGKLSDFGLALPDIKKIDTSTLKEYQYMLHLAPEVDKIKDYDYLSDIYSCGMTLYRLFNGDRYITSVLRTGLREQIKKGKFPNRDMYREFIPPQLRKVINKALSVDPKNRYQSAEAMRHALEQVPLFTDWEETLLSNGISWKTEKNQQIIEVSRIKNGNGLWNVETRRGKDKSSLRKVNSLCAIDAGLKDAIKFSNQILHGYVTKR